VLGFQALGPQFVFVQFTDFSSKAYADYGGPVPAVGITRSPFLAGDPAQIIDAKVRAFRACDSEHVYVLGTDGNLWLEQSPFGPAHRVQVDADVIEARVRTPGTHGGALPSDGNGGDDN
jgi:hypothetical protein